MTTDIYPLPHKVGLYGDETEFCSCRLESGQWVFWEDRVRAILDGKYYEVKPLHVELSPTYLCNFSCPWCSCRSIRSDWQGIDVFTKSSSNSEVMGKDKLVRILDQLREHNIAIQWAGGEPTMHKYFYDGVKIASYYGLSQCLFTNGSLLNEDKITSLIESNLAFIRFSLDAVTPSVHAKHHGYSINKKYYEKVAENIEKIIKKKIDCKSELPSIGLSIVVDETNIDDIKNTLSYASNIAFKYGKQAIEYVIIRCIQDYPGVVSNKTHETSSKLIKVIRDNNLVSLLEQKGVKLVFSETAENLDAKPETRNWNNCIGGSMFGEVMPSGDILHCSDRYGSQDYIVGNLSQNSVDEIWDSKRRQETLRRINSSKCLIKNCPRNGRGYFFNRLFYQIEEYRRENKLDLVENWIYDLRNVLPRPDHPFFI